MEKQNLLPLHDAAIKGDFNKLYELLNSSLNLNVNARNILGNSPLALAAFKGDLECVKLLVEHGSNIHSINLYGISIFHSAFFSGNIEIMKYLANMKCKTNLDIDDSYFRGYNGKKENYEECKKYLLEYIKNK